MDRGYNIVIHSVNINHYCNIILQTISSESGDTGIVKKSFLEAGALSEFLEMG